MISRSLKNVWSMVKNTWIVMDMYFAPPLLNVNGGTLYMLYNGFSLEHLARKRAQYGFFNYNILLSYLFWIEKYILTLIITL